MRDYDKVIVELFNRVYKAEADRLPFTKDQMADVCDDLGIRVKNIPDIIYTYRARSELPEPIVQTGNWIIQGTGKGRYAFVRLERPPHIEIPPDLKIIRILDSTPEMVLKYSGSDEQSLMAKIRYNRLIDTFLGITAYQLQSHFRTTLDGIGQVEIDELYLGVDTEGRQYVVPIEAKGPHPREKLGVAQVSWLAALAIQQYPGLIPRPVGAKAWEDDSIFLVEFTPETDSDKISVVKYKRYMLYHEEERRRPEASQSRLLGNEESLE